MCGIRIIQRLFRRRLSRATTKTLDHWRQATQRHHDQLSRELTNLGACSGPMISFGTTQWGQTVALPLDKIVQHSMCVGSSGSGKSFFCLSIIQQLISNPSILDKVSFALLDPKRETFNRLSELVFACLYRLPSAQRERLKQRIVIIDFANDNVIAPYNILVRRDYLPDELMVANRIDTISEQFSGLSEVSVRMKSILKYALLLLAEYDLPISFFERICTDSWLLTSLVERSKNPQVRNYFLNRFDSESKSTLLALRQRIDALLMSEGVRLSLSAPSAPDFTLLQDQGGSIVLITTAGPNINRGVSELLQGLVLSDIKQSVFRRQNPGHKFLFFLDESQLLYKSPANRTHMVDLLTMARSFGSFCVLLTQSLTSAVHDQDVLNSILANVGWIVMLQSTLRDSNLIAPAIHLTGKMPKRKHNPYEETKYLTESQELQARLNEITKLPNRLAYVWLKAHLSSAVKLTTPYVPAPHEVAGCSQQEFETFMKTETIGQGTPKAEILKLAAERQERLDRLIRRHSDDTTSAQPGKTRRKGQGSARLGRILEEEYAKKKDIDAGKK
jgi:hypothetical protein